ncbi:MAG TPA: tetratricopeptide repeat protein, partial [Terriglobia bacterium]|nr:tetratricopeptide repeat protein [Terriglobia bacterium]
MKFVFLGPIRLAIPHPFKVNYLLSVLAFISVAGYSQDVSLPESLQLLFTSGVEALKKGDLDSAKRSFQAVIDRGGKLSFVYNNLGAAYQQGKQHSQALTQFREAIRLQPDYASPHILAAASLMAIEKFPDAIKELEYAAKLQPNEPLVRLQLAKAYEQTGDLFGRVEQYQRLREINPKEPEYAFQLGRAFMELAAWCSQEIERIDPSSARLQQSIANSYVYQGNNEKAIAALKKAIQVAPKLPDLHLA